MKTRPQATEVFLDSQAPRAEKGQGGLQDWDFLARQEKEDSQELQAAWVRGAPTAQRVRKVIVNVSCGTMASEAMEAQVSLPSGHSYSSCGRTAK